jgi:hypothetical protein
MKKHQHWGRARIILAVSILCIAALAGAGLAADTGPLPARQWNQENLSRIKGLAAEPLTFTVMGDNRDNPEIFGKVLKQADNDPGLTFAIHLGDMVHNADLDQYCTFFNEVGQNYRQPMVTVIGNHELYGEQGLELYREIFGPDYYSFQVGENYFIVVDDAAQEVMTPEQFSWLEAELKKAQDYKTRLVFLHVPLFDPSGSPKPHSLPPEVAARLLALFKEYQVSHVFAAHLHGYYAGAWEGLPYTITGGAGAPMYGKNTRHDFYHYVKVTIAGGKVKMQVRPLADREGK